MDDWVRVRLGRVGGDVVATPLPRGAGVLTSLVRADGLLVVPAGARGPPRGRAGRGRAAARRRARSTARSSRSAPTTWCSTSPPPSCAPRDPRVTLASSNVGSLGGLVALRDGLCHLAGSHLLDPATGEYTLPYVDRVLGRPRRRGRAARAPRAGADRRARATRSALAAIEDLARAGVRYVNRQRGAGTRVLLDHELRRAGHRARRASPGYDARGAHPPGGRRRRRRRPRRLPGSACWPPRAPSASDFVPVAREPYDLVLDAETLEDPVLAPLWALLEQPGVPGRDRGARRLRRRGHGPADPLRIGAGPALRDRRLTRRPQRMYP